MSVVTQLSELKTAILGWDVSFFSTETCPSKTCFSPSLLSTVSRLFSTNESPAVRVSFSEFIVFVIIESSTFVKSQCSLMWLHNNEVMSQQEIFPAVSPANIITSGLPLVQKSIT